MKTYLEDSVNNRIVKVDENGKVFLSEIKKSIEHRIAKHMEYIDEDILYIKENFYLAELVLEKAERINERYAKIGELKEFLEFSLCIPE